MPVNERDQASGSDLHQFACWRFPENLPVEGPRLHIEPPVIATQMCIRQPERFVVHKELDDLAVGYVEDRLASFRKTVRFFGVQDRSSLIEAVDKRTVLADRPSFLKAAAH